VLHPKIAIAHPIKKKYNFILYLIFISIRLQMYNIYLVTDANLKQKILGIGCTSLPQAALRLQGVIHICLLTVAL
jgi:hypothetical protein